MANAVSMNLEVPAKKALRPKAEKRPKVSSALFYFLTAGQVITSTLHVLLVHMSKAEAELPGASPGAPGAAPLAAPTSPAEGGYAYSTSAVIVVAEFSKLVVCLLLFLGTNEDPGAAFRRDVSLRKFLQFSIPALVYAVENNMSPLSPLPFSLFPLPPLSHPTLPLCPFPLLPGVLPSHPPPHAFWAPPPPPLHPPRPPMPDRFLVLRKLESPVTFVVFSHLEIPIVALMSVLCLNRHLNKLQWASVFLLLNGVMASQVSVCESQHTHSCSHLSDYPLLAVAIVVLVSMLSALAGISTEYLFQKSYSTSIFLQNAQLYTYGTVINLAGMAAHEPDRLLHPSTLFDGFDATVAGIVATLVMLGLFVSGVVKHMSNITKVYASACGIFITSILSTFVSDFDMTFPFILAASQVVCALYLYHVDMGVKDPGGQLAAAPCTHCGKLPPAPAGDKGEEGEEGEDGEEEEMMSEDDLEGGEEREAVRLLPPPATETTS
eukprot:jgi/Mesvir1/28076/Mv04669-RA.1